MAKEHKDQQEQDRSENEELLSYEPPKVESMKLTDEAAEALT